MKPQVIFFGNGLLADYALPVLEDGTEIIFHARRKANLARVVELKKQYPKAFGVLASFGVMIPTDLLELFEPEGILNLHPSLLPKYRGPSPIETGILEGDTEFGFSIMKLVKEMDAGPIYYQEVVAGLDGDKKAIYRGLAERGAQWLVDNLPKIRELEPIPQDDDEATYTRKFDTTMSELDPTGSTAAELGRQVIAFEGFPKAKYWFCGKKCIINEVKPAVVDVEEIEKLEENVWATKKRLFLAGRDGDMIEIVRLQPEGKRPMDAAAFLNGYSKNLDLF